MLSSGFAAHLQNLYKLLPNRQPMVVELHDSSLLERTRFKHRVGPHLLEDVFRQYYPEIKRYLQSKVNDEDTAEDLAAETFERVLRFGHRYRDGNMRAWIRTIARNTFINLYRREQRIQELEYYALQSGENLGTLSNYSRGRTPEQMTLRKIGLEELIKEIKQKVPLPYQQAIICREIDGLGYQEIAAELSIPLGTVMSRLHRGRKYFKNFVDAQKGYEP